jgi:hypothetical protein
MTPLEQAMERHDFFGVVTIFFTLAVCLYARKEFGPDEPIVYLSWASFVLAAIWLHVGVALLKKSPST